MKGTHNSLSYLPVAQWWLKPFSWVARCQKKDIRAQVASGVRYFDLRAKLKKGKYVSGHGLITYNKELYEVLELLDYYCIKDNIKIYVRLMLEDSSSVENFKLEVELWKEMYRGICFLDVIQKKGFITLLTGEKVDENHEYQLFQDYSATTFWGKVKGVKFPWPWYWACKNNKRLSATIVSDNIYHIIDFV